MISVVYSCDKCGIHNRTVQVPARETPDIDVRDWMNRTLQFIGDDHLLVSPVCQTSCLQNVMIPLKNAEGIEAEFIGQQIE